MGREPVRRRRLAAWRVAGLRERADVRYVVRDWLAKLQIVAAGLAITTVAPVVLRAVPDGVKIVAVRGEPQEVRRLVLARLPGRWIRRRPSRRRAHGRGGAMNSAAHPLLGTIRSPRLRRGSINRGARI